MKHPEIKSECKRRYLSGETIEEILGAVKGSTKSTLSRWINEGKWKEEREKNLASSNRTAELLRTQIENLIKTIDELGKSVMDAEDEEVVKTKSDLIVKFGDTLAKLNKIENTLFKNSNPKENILFAVGELGIFLKDNNLGLDKDFFGKLDVVLAAFTEYSLKKYAAR